MIAHLLSSLPPKDVDRFDRIPEMEIRIGACEMVHDGKGLFGRRGLMV